ncbi:neuropeptide F receptor [Caerostris extrusa]|uniref:Neuropeptide F receptor n=1 Tax=Caerostris extrusa TaxID=172846 RepID=A0AAV4WXV9_CAEEX|nr:neuropeptide F receptor [Caerostris extrusa]
MESVPLFGDDIPDEEMFVPLMLSMTILRATASFFKVMETPRKIYQEAFLLERLQPYMNNRAIDDTALAILMTIYIILIVTGATGNGLVCIAVARKAAMRTARNVFIINLAISDFLLCVFTMPFSLVEITVKFWPLGVLPCKLVAGLQGTSIFVSTISITAIALDRYKVIVYPTQETCLLFGTKHQEKQAHDKKRVKKTISFLYPSLIFGLSWLPLNILNVVSDFFYPFSDNSTFRLVFACCHMAGMSSACSNPCFMDG